jgi:hypothetical protein
MSGPAIALQKAVIAHLSAAPALAELTGVYDGPPPRAAFPYAALGDGVSADWSTKTEQGREIRFAVTLWDDGEAPARLHRLTGAVEAAMATLPRALEGSRIVSLVFLRSILARDPAGPWAGLVEHRIRILQDQEI